MKPNNILTATAMILIFSSLLSGCKVELPQNEGSSANTTTQQATQPAKISEQTQQLIQKAETVKKEVTLSVEADQQAGELRVKIKLNNPAQKPISSVQSWISYNPDHLIGKKVESKDSSFLLMAPYDNTFDAEKGLVMVGRSHPKPLTDESLLVAELIFDINTSSPITLDAYDYQSDLTGHSSVNILIDGNAYNILIQPENPLLIIQNS